MRIDERVLRVAELGPLSPLPPVEALPAPPYEVGADIPAELVTGAAYGGVPNMYPYLSQDGYSRTTAEHKVRAVVLENTRLRAVFLPSLGGRLWELYDKVQDKALVHTQQSVQFANLALRNAWFAGGIEFNIGTRGHSPTTCSPLHAALVHTPEGMDVLRMWEFDRLREVVFQLDAWLPEDSAVLFVAVRIRNPNPHEVPMYWWSNAAVPQREKTRVIAPAARAFKADYRGGIRTVRPQEDEGTDATWPVRNRRAADFFFDLAPEQRPWIVSADDDGDGLAMLSSAALRGRKLFVWGESPGGHRWQEWLSPGGGRYAEIQAGLAQTQFEHLAMPAGASWQWVEAYGNPRLAAGPAHSTDWAEAVQHAQGRVDQLVSSAALGQALADARRWADLSPAQPVLTGSGWGALEAQRRNGGQPVPEGAPAEQSGTEAGYGWVEPVAGPETAWEIKLGTVPEAAQGTGQSASVSAPGAGHEAGPGGRRLPWIDDSGTPFPPTSMDEEQRPWRELLETGSFFGAESFVVGPDWEARLRGVLSAAPQAAPPATPAATPAAAGLPPLSGGGEADPAARKAAFQLASMLHARQDHAAARPLYVQAITGSAAGQQPPDAASAAPAPGLDSATLALAHRGLGLALVALGDAAAGLEQLRMACAASRASRPLLAEAMSVHLHHGMPVDALELVRSAPPELTGNARIGFLTALAHARAGNPAKAAALLRAGLEVPDLREGENSITDLWLEVCPNEPVPARYQFSMG
ncbi:DUF5107 domain-containing protein [Paenarthrobacter sp. PH39-S1]|uniref:DUF5107 domain-containing protein n=1 Tax=Paenarthrobacter sp. PH39-S1 TaxID=3046204 RepID=UPI0024B9A585|nr:DUF5107 domain-containing protein [Paenarthrobacter sp. PH39-S1]MDJ0354675.1 DUF5107 domain-containing protein [Paenarthrobacter sp. PH39-S1]